MLAMTVAEAREKVAECMQLAAMARRTSNQIMLQHIAETWERIAKDIESQDTSH